MTDASTRLPSNLTLKLLWPSDQVSLIGEQSVVVELQFADGTALVSVSIPHHQLLQAVAQKLAHYHVISPDGFLSVLSDEIPNGIPEQNAVPLDQIVAEATSPDMLEDEPTAAVMLAEFRIRLLKSLEHVEQALATLPKP